MQHTQHTAAQQQRIANFAAAAQALRDAWQAMCNATDNCDGDELANQHTIPDLIELFEGGPDLTETTIFANELEDYLPD